MIIESHGNLFSLEMTKGEALDMIKTLSEMVIRAETLGNSWLSNGIIVKDGAEHTPGRLHISVEK